MADAGSSMWTAGEQQHVGASSQDGAAARQLEGVALQHSCRATLWLPGCAADAAATCATCTSITLPPPLPAHPPLARLLAPQLLMQRRRQRRPALHLLPRLPHQLPLLPQGGLKPLLELLSSGLVVLAALALPAGKKRAGQGQGACPRLQDR